MLLMLLSSTTASQPMETLPMSVYHVNPLHEGIFPLDSAHRPVFSRFAFFCGTAGYC